MAPVLKTGVSAEFVEEVELLVTRTGMTHIDAVVHWCESRGLEAEFGASMVKKSARLKKVIREEAERLHFMRK